MLVSPTCVKLRKAYAGGYCFKKLKVAGDRYKLEPDKDEHSHVADSAQYAFIEMGENPRAINMARPPTGMITHTDRPWKVFG